MFHVQLFADHIRENSNPLQSSRVTTNDMKSAKRLAHFQIMIRSELASEADGHNDIVHLRFQFGIPPPPIADREITEMHGLGHVRCPQIPVDCLADEGHERSRNLRESQEYLVERGIGLRLVLIVCALPEAPAAAPDIPVGQVLDKSHERADCLLEIVPVHRLHDVRGQALQ